MPRSTGPHRLIYNANVNCSINPSECAAANVWTAAVLRRDDHPQINSIRWWTVFISMLMHPGNSGAKFLSHIPLEMPKVPKNYNLEDMPKVNLRITTNAAQCVFFFRKVGVSLRSIRKRLSRGGTAETIARVPLPGSVGTLSVLNGIIKQRSGPEISVGRISWLFFLILVY